ncbi:FGGY family carbohydrate kinase [Martelella sp. AD-3]|uniref:FGGY-family carbohydrate kinase n=1 Tax=Martelella sp. AD-3 TaxID=686597 RepID=UPI0004644D81|nr:FGGY family carbohydrate kinase [Martelella sp. AD-3]AMM86001.1 hypothetical protein AZF01_17945 [Martelella sp. AD-3]
MTELRIGLDVGTTAIKVAAYTPEGKCVAGAARVNKVSRPAPGHAEQDMEAIWTLTAECLSELSAKCEGASFAALGVCAQGDGLWLMDEAGAPCGNAMLWNDTRASADLETLNGRGATGAVGLGCHTDLWPGTSAMLWRWLRRNRPETALRARAAFTCADWIGYRLTGQIATDFSNASIPLIDFDTRSYGPRQIDLLECNDLGSILARPRHASEQLGRLSAEAGRRTGLPEGLPVSVGTLDLAAMIVGMGLDRPGQTMMILGTTAVVNILTDHVTPTEKPVGASALHPTSEAIIRILAPSTGAAAFDWFTALHPKSLGGESTDEIAGKLNALVENVPPGANGVTFLPYLNGERAPFVSPDIRAQFHGLRADTTKAEMGRAVMEGTAMSLRHCFEAEDGLPPAPVQLTGGGSKNPVWCQIIADVIGQDIVVSPASDQGLWGAACLGAAAAGLGDAIALSRREETAVVYRARPEIHARYSTVYRRYALISSAMRTLQTALNSLKEENA